MFWYFDCAGECVFVLNKLRNPLILFFDMEFFKSKYMVVMSLMCKYRFYVLNLKQNNITFNK